MAEWSKQDAAAFFAALFRGEHHIPGELKRFGTGWRVGKVNPLSSFDFDELTRLVLLAHEHAVRVEVRPCGPQFLSICAWKRTPLEPSLRHFLTEGHPSIDQVADKWRTARHSSWTRYLTGKSTIGESEP